MVTDAELEPDGRLEGFDPCGDCRACITACPAEAYGVDGSYHTSWSQEKCESKSREPNGGAFRCGLGGRCWEICPAGKYSDEELFLMDSRSRRCLEILSNIFSSIAANLKQ